MLTKKTASAALLALALLVLAPLSASAWIGEDGWDYTWDDPVLYSYCFNNSCNGSNDYNYGSYGSGYSSGGSMSNSYSPYQNQYANSYQAFQPMYYQSQYQSTYQSQYQQQYQYQPQSYGYGQPAYGQYGYGQQASYQAFGFSNGSPTGDTIPYLNEPICDYPGYGRYSCLYHPGQPLYDYWTGTWY